MFNAVSAEMGIEQSPKTRSPRAPTAGWSIQMRTGVLRGHDSSGKASRAFFTTGCMVAAGGESCQAGEDVGAVRLAVPLPACPAR